VLILGFGRDEKCLVKTVKHLLTKPFLFGMIIFACGYLASVHGGYGEAVNAPDCGSGTRGFDPHYPPHDPLAQSVEHLTFNQGVPRSSRGWITIR
jgi:hypothetical protein